MADKLATIMEDEVDKLDKDVESDYLSLLKANSPVDMDGDDPGKLRRSWDGSTRRLGKRGRLIEAENDCGYTPYVEYGTASSCMINFEGGSADISLSRRA